MATATVPPTDPAAATKTYTQEDLNQFASRAREEEKQKLYPDIERHKKEVQKLAEEKRALEAQLEGLKGTTTEAQQLKGDLAKLKAEQVATEERFRATVNEILEQTRRDALERDRKNSLEALRRELIASAAGTCIPSLVRGGTEEEIRASFESAKAEYKRIADAAEVKAKAEYEEKLKAALPTAVNTAPTDSSADIQGGIDSWRRLSPADWEAQKTKITEEAFKKAGLPMKAGTTASIRR